MIFLRVFALVAFVLNANALSAEECESNPCRSFDLAMKCDKLSRCIPVWMEETNLDDERRQSCLLCKFISALPNDLMPERKVYHLKLLCQNFEDRDSYYKCIGAITGSFLESVDQDVCDSAGLCPLTQSGESDVALQKRKACDVCKKLIDSVSNFVKNNNSEALVASLLMNVCNYLPQFKAECKLLVRNYVHIIFQIFKKSLNSTRICRSLHICSKQNKVEEIEIDDSRVEEHVAMVDLVPARTDVMKKDKCKACIKVAKFVKSLLKNKKTEKVVKILLLKFCNVNPLIAITCKTIANKYLGQLLKLLSDKVDPEQACAKLKFCNKKDDMLLESSLFVPDSSVYVEKVGCTFCLQIAEITQKCLARNMTRGQILFLLNTICVKFPDIKVECQKFMNHNADRIIELEKQKLTPNQTCSKLEYCPALMVPARTDGDKCKGCIKVAKFVKSLLKDKKTEKVVKILLLKFCNVNPLIAVTCKTIANKYLGELLKLLSDKVDPEQACAKLKFCNKDDMLLESSLFVPEEIYDSLDVKKVECAFCLRIALFTRFYLSMNMSRNEIITLLNKMCTKFPDISVQECQKFVSDNIGKIIELEKQKMTIKQTCSKLDYCPAVLLSEDVSNSCELCKQWITMIKNLLLNKKTQDEILHYMENVCNSLSPPYKNVCKSLVKQYLPEIIKRLNQNIDPARICAELRLCSQIVDEVVSRGDTCQTCKVVVEKVDTMLKHNMSYLEMKEYLDHFCGTKNPAFKKLCVETVRKYLPQIIAMLRDNIRPNTICTQLHRCESAQQKVKDKKKTCALCKVMVKIVKKMLDNKKTQSEISKYLVQYCDKASPLLKSLCKEIAQKYLPQIIKLLNDRVNPDQVCSKISLCTEMNDFSYCALCTAIVRKVGSLVENGRSDQEITDILDSFCNRFIITTKMRCKKIISSYLANIIDDIKRGKPAESICADLGFCYSDTNNQDNITL